jgi:hypothetical protein
MLVDTADGAGVSEADAVASDARGAIKLVFSSQPGSGIRQGA